jgi:preprotein translocase subunit SecB
MSQEKGTLFINAQYIKDISFENPRAPFSLLAKDQPEIDINLDIRVEQLQEELFEVVINLIARAITKEEIVFLLELSYGGLFTISGYEELREEVLLVECPKILFPFLRRIVADITRDGGFPPLMLSPVDFKGLYLMKKNPDSQDGN